MKKENISSIIVYLLMIGLALFIGLGIIKPIFAANPAVNMNQYLFAILAVVIGVVLNAVILEAGHVIGALLGKNKIIYVNMFGVSLNFDQSGKKIEIQNYEGLTGETKFAPKSDDASPKLSIIIPLLLYVLELVIAVILYATITKSGNHDLIWLSIGSIIAASIGGMMTLYNIMPFRLDVETDGYRLMLFSKKVNVEAFNAFRKLELEELNQGIKIFEEITDYTVVANVINTYPQLAKKDYESVAKALEDIIDNKEKLSTIIYNRVFAHLIYVKAMTLSVDDFKAFYRDSETEIRRFLASDLSLPSIRAYILISGLLDDSEGEVRHGLEKKKKAMKHTAFGLRKIEEQLLKEALNKVLEYHPNWQIDNN